MIKATNETFFTRWLQDVEIENLTKELQELQELKEQNLDASKLATALESEQLGASRAVSQNQQLKRQLNEIQNAFVLLVRICRIFNHNFKW